MRIRTGYSFRTAVGHLGDVTKRLEAIGLEAWPISDRNSTFGFNRWNKLCEKAGKRPVFGVEIAVTPVMGEKKPVLDYWTFFAIDHLRALHDLIATATTNVGKEPSLSYVQALKAPGLIKISGERLQLDALDRAEAEIMAASDGIEIESPLTNFYVGLSPSTPKGLVTEAKKIGFDFIALSDNVYPTPDDTELYRVGLGRRSFTQTYPQHILSHEEWAEAVKWTADGATVASALENQRVAISRCQAKLIQAEMLIPEKPVSLRAMCETGAAKLNIDLTDPVYAARLDRELELIADKKFEDYFYIIADMISWAKEKMIVGPARGSSCGSLVCYLLGVTTIDPIPYGLIFERFIDVNRTDLPDVDIDFSDTRRDLVFKYVEQKYGSERVARLGTVGLFKPRSALKQAASGLRIPSWKVDRVLEGLIERSSADSRALQALEDTLNDTDAGRMMLKDHPEVLIAAKMEGHPNNASQHAAGIVITQKPVAEYVAVDARTKSAMCDKKDAEALNLLKIDALGLTQLSIFERTLQLLGLPDKSGWLEKLPIDDAAAFEVLNKGKWAGIFQFAGSALQSLTKQVVIDNIEDIVSITALARPGPMATGGANSWTKRRMGLEEITSIHPLLAELTKDTYGIVIYQETVMNIVRHMGGLSWEDTSAIRKAMSGTMGDEFFNKFSIKFIDGAEKNGVPREIAREIWDQINTFGSWAFNRSHAVAYGMVSYWCCWLKAHHPLEFAAATLDAETDPLRQIKLLRELKAEGIDYVPVDGELSSDRWAPAEKEGKKILVGPLTSIKGIGPAGVLEIISSRKLGQPLRATLAKRLASAKTDIDSLYPVADAVRRLHPDLTRIKIFSEPTPVIDIQAGVRGEVMAFVVARRIAPRDENDAQNVAKRGRKLDGPTQALNMFMADDTDEIFCKIGRYDFERIGREVVERGKVGKALYAVKGTVPNNFRMISVKQIRYLGDLDQDAIVEEETKDAAE